MTSGRRSSSCRGKPGGGRRRHGRQLGAHGEFRRRITPEEGLDRALRLAARALKLAQVILVAGQRGLREGDVPLVCPADPLAHLRQCDQLLRRVDRLLGQIDLRRQFFGAEPRARQRRDEGLARVRGICHRRGVLGGRRHAAVADTAPHVDLPGGEQEGAPHPARIGAQLAAALAGGGERRLQRAAGGLHEDPRLLDARLCDLQIRVVGECLRRQCFERRIVELAQPTALHGFRTRALCDPLRGEVHLRHGRACKLRRGGGGVQVNAAGTGRERCHQSGAAHPDQPPLQCDLPDIRSHH